MTKEIEMKNELLKLNTNINTMIDILQDFQQAQRQLAHRNQMILEKVDALITAFGSVNVDSQRAAEINAYNVYNLSRIDDSLAALVVATQKNPTITIDESTVIKIMDVLEDMLHKPLKQIVTQEVGSTVRETVQDLQSQPIKHQAVFEDDEEDDEESTSKSYSGFAFSKRDWLIVLGFVAVMVLFGMLPIILPFHALHGVVTVVKWLGIIGTGIGAGQWLAKRGDE